VREALQTRPDTKVVFVSGYAEEAFSDEKSMIPNSVFLPKPFSLKQLTGTVSRQLQSDPADRKGADSPKAASLP
jgi:two-component system cell cycle sensor histidine kinase/response regulator CckA